MSNNVTITLPVATEIRRFGNEAETIIWADIPATILPLILEVGARTVLTNAYNGGGKDATEAEKRSQLQKKLASWYRGEFTVVSRGDSQMTAMREQYIDERRTAAGMTRAAVEKQMKDLVKATFGDKESATFSRFLDAVASVKAKANGSDLHKVREQIETDLAARTEKAAQARAKVASKLDLSAVDLGF